ncbi:sphinganine C4-monooxygenase 2-like [Durio zibethinus]|uniref:Sphinganine C4-monooxygenase 2-like n=1 Tax=Durio zibethinus TaxID=66656 RepID=A0A6P6BFA3_DURZI|nr:sphinganine C4-monooxygenase 2-like [Durio zibethinus]
MAAFQVSDEILASVVPNIVYWVYSWMYIALGSCDNYRLHPKEDVDEKNLVTKEAVIKNVLWQQLRQVIAYLLLYKVTRKDDDSIGQPSSFIVIATQFVVAMVVLDTYQYFLHRLVHQNKFLYKHLHSQHHRLVIPYTYGAIYNHPIEGFFFDIVGGILAYVVSGMSPRTAIFFYCFATIKNVDDHCGVLLPGNPMQLLKNSTAFHDFHHQHCGGKYNFSQPFFVFWDKILGTYMPLSLEKKAEGGFEARPAKDSKE